MNRKEIEKVYYDLMDAIDNCFMGNITDSELGDIVYRMKDELLEILADTLESMDNEAELNNAAQVIFHVHMTNGTTLHIESPVESVDYLSDDIFDDEAKFIEINGHYINKSRIDYIDWEVEEQKVKSLINIGKEDIKIQGDKIILNKEDVETLRNCANFDEMINGGK